MKKSLLTVIGFLLFVLGIVSIILSVVGMQFKLLLWQDQLGSLWAFIIRILMIFIGIILVYLTNTQWKENG